MMQTEEHEEVYPVCPHCKTDNIPGASFCNHCGEKLG